MASNVMMFPKPVTYRSEDYLAFIRRHKCLLCGSPSNELPKPKNNIVAHHEGLGLNMQSSTAPDSHCVPLCGMCHTKRHWIGYRIWDEKNRDIKMEIIKLLTEYLQGKG